MLVGFRHSHFGKTAPACLMARATPRAKTNVGCIDLGKGKWTPAHSTNQRYARDNRLIIPKSPYRRNCLAPRCWLIISWGWKRSQGFGCSPIKMVPELSLERRETVWILPGVRAKNWENHFLVREDRKCSTSGALVVLPRAWPGSYVERGEPLKAS